MTDDSRPHHPGSTILVVEDDATISDLLTYNLRRAGFTVRQERTGTGGLTAALESSPGLVLLDLMLPGLDGLTTAREIRRRRPALPIIMLTAHADRETVLDGFKAGADDFVAKPFDMDVLLARIHARLRGASAAPEETAETRGVSAGGVVLDPDHLTVRGPDGTRALKPKEYDLLALFLSNPGRLFSRKELVERVWRQKYLPSSRSLDVHVRRVRSALEVVGAAAEIQTTRGVGYLMRLVSNREGTGE